MTKEVLQHNNLSKLKFNGKWRSYQARVLKELDNHLLDSKLNIVAAPGAGKTILGIEVMRRLGMPTLILAPTITIRNQWKERILQNFLRECNDNDLQEDFISTNIKDVKTITITTYQSLHSVYKTPELLKIFLKTLEENNVKTLVLDESHHLRTEWYQTLDRLCKDLGNKSFFRTVSLTGTPPYDVSPAEWNNYHTLCGPVDSEISIPELVKNGDLCPHQELIWFSDLAQEEKEIVFDFAKNRDEFFDYIEKNSDFLYAIRTSPFLSDLDANFDLIYEDTDFTLALVSYLLKNDELDTSARLLIEFLGIEIDDVPAFDFSIAETLFNGFLGKYEKYFKNIPVVKGKLKELKLLESSKKVDFTGDFNFKKLFARSRNKINSIKKISDLEYSILEDDLREVVLLDYIGTRGSAGVNILSVFEQLKSQPYKVGILTGSLVIIPENAKELLNELVHTNGYKSDSVLTIEYCSGYLRVETYGNVDLVKLVTEIFQQGAINVLVGTQSLLGEGWDSPCVNTLIIASVVGSFMLSNQMRGRALRIDKQNPNKIADIWHLVSLEWAQNQDWDVVQRRFSTFEGISYVDNTIQSGVERLGINFDTLVRTNCDKLNAVFIERAKSRNTVRKKWNQIFDKSVINEKDFAPQVYDVICYAKVKLPEICTHNQDNWFFKNIFNPCFLKLKTGYSQNAALRIAQGVLQAMCEMGLIKTMLSDIKLESYISKDYIPYITLNGCTNYERKLFVDCFGEIFTPPKNHRYILKKKDKYLTVPEIIGTKKQNVKILVKYLEPYYGYLDLIFTRWPEGRRELLKARFNGIATSKVDTTRIWL